MEQKQQNQQEQGGQTFHAPNTGWAADYDTAGASRPAAKRSQLSSVSQPRVGS